MRLLQSEYYKNRFIAWAARPPYIGVVWLAWLYVVACCLYTRGMPFDGRLQWFDDNVRMVQVLDWLNGPGLLQGWYNRTIMRVNQPEGFHTIWSRLVDVPIAAIILTFQHITGQRYAALMAAALIPLTQVLLLFIAASGFAAPLLGRQRARLVVLFVLFSSCLNPQYFTLAGFQMGAAGHHAWYVLLVLTLFGALGHLLIAPNRRSILIGAAAITGLSAIGIEGFPLMAGGFALVSLIGWWFQRAAVIRALIWVAALGGVGGLILLPANQPFARLLTVSFAEPSILGPLLMAGAAVFFAAQYGLMRRTNDRRFLCFCGMAIVAVMLAGAFVYCFPQALHGGTAALSPQERHLAAAEHTEARTLFQVAVHGYDYVYLIAPSLVAFLFGGIFLARRLTVRRRILALYYLGLAILSFGLASVYSRYFHYAELTACPLMALMWLDGKKRITPGAWRGVKNFALYTFSGPFWLLLLPALFTDAPMTTHVLMFPSWRQAENEKCDISSIADFVNQRFPPETMMLVPMYTSDKFLFRTHVQLMFLANFPSQDKFIDAKNFYDSADPEIPKAIARRHGLDAVALCDTNYSLTSRNVEQKTFAYQLVAHHMSFGQQLALDQTPDWLIPIDPHAPTRYKLYVVDKGKLGR